MPNSKYNSYKYAYEDFEFYIDVASREDGTFDIELKNHNEEQNYPLLKCTTKDKRSSINKIKKYTREYLAKGEFIKLYNLGYSVYCNRHPILKEAKDGFGFHFADSNNSEKISQYGLVPNGTQSNSVIEANITIDYHRPFSLVNTIYRTHSVFLYHQIENGNFSNWRRLVDLWAVDLKELPKEYFMFGSQGIGGFCMNMSYAKEENSTDAEMKKFFKDTNIWAKKYWKNACTWEEYINQTDRYKRIDSYWGLDEMIYSGHIPARYIKKIGSWSNDGVFTIVDAFEDYVTNTKTYKDTLNIFSQLNDKTDY